MPWATRAVAAMLIGALAACATPETDRLFSIRDQLPERTELVGVPFFPQEEAYCGPAALASVLAWSGLPATQRQIAAEVYTPGRGGTLQADILASARRNGRMAIAVDTLADIVREVSKGRPVLVFQNLALDWYPRWHYAVVFGYDLGAGTMLLHSGREERHVVEFAAFERTWARGGSWALFVLPPGKLPENVTEKTALDAAAALSRAGREDAAEAAFTAISRRWPANAVAWLGLGNARYALGKYRGAERAFRAAIERAPRNADAWNNLAYALAKQGRRADALAAARKAVAFGAPGNQTYRDTLRELAAETL
jgi:hypothetical protein